MVARGSQYGSIATTCSTPSNANLQLRISTPPPFGYVVATVHEARGVFGGLAEIAESLQHNFVAVEAAGKLRW